MRILCFGQKSSMEKNQIIELWRSLSPRLTRAIPRQELGKHEDTDEEKRYEDRKEETVDSVVNHHEEDDV
jgi:hypothetical protein